MEACWVHANELKIKKHDGVHGNDEIKDNMFLIQGYANHVEWVTLDQSF